MSIDIRENSISHSNIVSNQQENKISSHDSSMQSVKSMTIGKGKVEIKSMQNLDEKVIQNIESSINEAFNNFKTAFHDNNITKQINVYAFDTQNDYKSYLNKHTIKFKKGKHFATHHGETEDIYFYLDRSGDFAYSSLKRGVAEVLIESNNNWQKGILPTAMKIGMADYIAGLNQNHEVTNNNDDCRDFTKIKNLTPHKILNNKKQGGRAEQVIKFLKQENSEDLSNLFRDLTKVQEKPQAGKKIVKEFMDKLQENQINTNFLQWISEQSKQPACIIGKFAKKSVEIDDTQITIQYDQSLSSDKIEDIEKTITNTFNKFKADFCGDGGCNIPGKINVFSFSTKSDYENYLKGTGQSYQESNGFTILKDNKGEAGIYFYLNQSSSSSALKQGIIQTIIQKNNWDQLPEAIKVGITDYMLGLKDSDFSEITKLTLQKILGSAEYKTLAGQAIKFFEQKHSEVIDNLIKKLTTISESEVQNEVNQFLEKLAKYDAEFKQWAQESSSDNTEERQILIDKIKKSSCFDGLDIREECRDIFDKLIKELEECNKRSSGKGEEEGEHELPIVSEEPKEEGKKPPEDKGGEKPGEKDMEPGEENLKPPEDKGGEKPGEKDMEPGEENLKPPEDKGGEKPGEKDMEPGEENLKPPEDKGGEKPGEKDMEPGEENLKPPEDKGGEKPGEKDMEPGEENLKPPEDKGGEKPGEKDMEPGEENLKPPEDKGGEKPGEKDMEPGEENLKPPEDKGGEKPGEKDMEPGEENLKPPEDKGGEKPGEKDMEPGEENLKPPVDEVVEPGKEPIKNIPDILKDFKNTLYGDQECGKKVGVSPVDELDYNNLKSQPNKSGNFVIIDHGDTAEIMLYSDEGNIRDLSMFKGSYCSDTVSLPYGHETYCSKVAEAAKVGQFLMEKHPDIITEYLQRFAELGEKSDCKNVISEVINGLQVYNDEFSEWLG